MRYLLFFACSLSIVLLHSQEWIEGLEVETYYISDAQDATDQDGGQLIEGSVTYRVFIDLGDGIRLRRIWADEDHRLLIKSSGEFFNNQDRGEVIGLDINDSRLDENTVALDSWLTIGAASDEHWGVLKTVDDDGTIVGGLNNDGGSENVPGGLLVNQEILPPLTQQDGLILDDSGILESLDVALFQGDIETVLGDANSTDSIVTHGLSLNAEPALAGIDDEGRLLIGQFTVTGELFLELNVELEDNLGEVRRFVAVENPNTLATTTLSPFLRFPFECGCTDPDFVEFDPAAPCDDGSCITPFVPGCTDPSACNYDPSANFGLEALCCYGPDDCNGLDFESVCDPLGLLEVHGSREMSLYPSPSTDVLYVESRFLSDTDVGWRILNLQGGLVQQGAQLRISPSDERLGIDVRRLPAGSYILELLLSDGPSIRSIFIRQ